MIENLQVLHCKEEASSLLCSTLEPHSHLLIPCVRTIRCFFFLVNLISSPFGLFKSLYEAVWLEDFWAWVSESFQNTFNLFSLSAFKQKDLFLHIFFLLFLFSQLVSRNDLKQLLLQTQPSDGELEYFAVLLNLRAEVRIRKMWKDVDSEVWVEWYVFIVKLNVLVFLLPDRGDLFTKDLQNVRISYFSRVLTKHYLSHFKSSFQRPHSIFRRCFHKHSLVNCIGHDVQFLNIGHVIFHVAESLALRINNDRVLVIDTFLVDYHVFIGCYLIGKAIDRPFCNLLFFAQNVFQWEISADLDIICLTQLLPYVLNNLDAITSLEGTEIGNKARGKNHISKQWKLFFSKSLFFAYPFTLFTTEWLIEGWSSSQFALCVFLFVEEILLFIRHLLFLSSKTFQSLLQLVKVVLLLPEFLLSNCDLLFCLI